MAIIIHCSVELRHQNNPVSKHGARPLCCAEDYDFSLVSQAK